MKSLFQSRLRNLGFSFLAMAIVLTCVWQVSVSGWIYVAQGWGEWQIYFLAYGDDFTVWRFKPPRNSNRDNGISVAAWPTDDDKKTFAPIYRTVIDFKAGISKTQGVCAGARDAADGPYVPPTDVTTSTLPYWSLVLPLAVFASALILWKPR